ncbi:MAG: alanine--glyoxylate aminotransferase family protein [Spirochaetia bacterium]|nr:alanine--glyoxylate aminotransferase family protein [Spirochaetia bacterium]
MKKKYLLAPGPVQIPPEILLEMAKPIIHHRTPEFEKTFADVQVLLKELFNTKNPVITFASSGTGAMEAAIVNTHSQNDEVMVIENGKFSERLALICKAFGLTTHILKIPDGESVSSGEIKKRLDENKNIKSVLLEYSETSTATMNDIESIAAVVSKTNALLIVDAITSLGVVDIPCDKWKLDVVIGGSQKSLMLPPGLSFLWLSDKAWERAKTSTLPKFYFDIHEELSALKKNTTAWTPAISLINGLYIALNMMKDYGWQNLYKKNVQLMKLVHAGTHALGLELFSKSPSVSVTAIKVPAGIDGNKLVDKLKNEQNITIAGGQSELKGKIFRVGTLGWIDHSDILVFFGALEVCLNQMGYKFAPGASLKAIQEELINHAQ